MNETNKQLNTKRIMSLLINVLSFIFVLKYGSLKLPYFCFESNLEMEIPQQIGEGRTSTEGHMAYVDDEIKSILKRPVLFHLGVNGLSSYCVIVSTRMREKCNRLKKKIGFILQLSFTGCRRMDMKCIYTCIFLKKK